MNACLNFGPWGNFPVQYYSFFCLLRSARYAILFQFKYGIIVPNFVKCFRNIKKNTSNLITAVKRFVNITSYTQKFIYTGVFRFKTRLIRGNQIVFNEKFYFTTNTESSKDGSFWEFVYKLFRRRKQLFSSNFGTYPSPNIDKK